MLRHPADREILRLAVPALGALAAEPLYLLVDTAVVGHLGTDELGGLAVAATVLTTAFFLFNFLAYGTTASVARLIGARQPAVAATHAVQGLWVALAAGAALLALGTVGAGGAVDLFGPGAGVEREATLYLRVSALGAPAVLVALVGVGYLRGVQDTTTTLLVALGSNVANLVLELLLVYGFDRGIGASALATVVAQYGAGAVYAVVMLRAARSAGVSLRPDWETLRRLVTVARALLVRTGSLLGALAVATAVASRAGEVALGAHQIAFQLWNFLALVLDALAIAGQAIVGRMLGSGDAAGARDAAKRMVRWALAVGFVFAAAVGAARHGLVPLFSDDPEVRRAALEVLVIVSLLQPVNAVVFVLDGVLIGAGDLSYLARAMAVSVAVVYLPAAAAVHSNGAGLLWLWGALGLLMVARLAGNVSRFAGRAWEVTGVR